mmetsp:Transcript_32904/g.97725  ORF Transcript_32904/g.97725 Transcript_32904/m.97725 type:complete len:239 (-) Transcript_32904:91-807(-)
MPLFGPDGIGTRQTRAQKENVSLHPAGGRPDCTEGRSKSEGPLHCVKANQAASLLQGEPGPHLGVHRLELGRHDLVLVPCVLDVRHEGLVELTGMLLALLRRRAPIVADQLKQGRRCHRVDHLRCFRAPFVATQEVRQVAFGGLRTGWRLLAPLLGKPLQRRQRLTAGAAVIDPALALRARGAAPGRGHAAKVPGRARSAVRPDDRARPWPLVVLPVVVVPVVLLLLLVLLDGPWGGG